MRAWYIPAWNGDWRLEPESDTKTVLTIENPTAGEKRVLVKLAKKFVEKKWIDAARSAKINDPSRVFKTKVTLDAPLVEVGPYVASIVKPGANVITAVRFKDGKIEVAETSTLGDDAWADEEKPTKSDRPSKTPEPAPAPAAASIIAAAPKEIDTPTEESKALAKKKDAEAAATVKRPTPCCPACYVDTDETDKPATEVLLSFLNEEEHASWAKHRCIVVHGGITGHRYRIAHRNSPIAAQQTRIAWDLDDDALMHFHDWTVPASEEVLATMLILKHREPWLRNEATAFQHRHVFKNPFGDGGDGVMDSTWTAGVGHRLLRALS